MYQLCCGLLLLILTTHLYASEPGLDEIKTAYSEWYTVFSGNINSLMEMSINAPRSTREDAISLMKESLTENTFLHEMIIDLCVKKQYKLCGNRRDRLYLKFIRIVFENSTPVHIIDNNNNHVVYLKPNSKLDSINPYRNIEFLKKNKLIHDVMPFATYQINNGKMKIQYLSKEFMTLVDNLHYQLWQ